MCAGVLGRGVGAFKMVLMLFVGKQPCPVRPLFYCFTWQAYGFDSVLQPGSRSQGLLHSAAQVCLIISFYKITLSFSFINREICMTHLLSRLWLTGFWIFLPSHQQKSSYGPRTHSATLSDGRGNTHTSPGNFRLYFYISRADMTTNRACGWLFKTF